MHVVSVHLGSSAFVCTMFSCIRTLTSSSLFILVSSKVFRRVGGGGGG
uniref:Uncharacterized protein n=1 Tax=Anguilla anguilla TaxID=7936 RepID=A0A0E9X266_ANGAN